VYEIARDLAIIPMTIARLIGALSDREVGLPAARPQRSGTLVIPVPVHAVEHYQHGRPAGRTAGTDPTMNLDSLFEMLLKRPELVSCARDHELDACA
jgi:hypothetical protein